MAFPLNDLGSALTEQIYQTLMGGDESVKPPADTFFTWCMPGFPISDKALDFAADGIFSAPTAEELRARQSHAFQFSMLVDYVPDLSLPYNSERQEGMFKPGGQVRVSEMYRQVLELSRVADQQITDEQKAKLEQFHGLLFTTKTVKDLITDEEKEVTEEGPLLRAYNETMAEYVTAAVEYNAKRIAAASATGPEGKAVAADFAINGQLYALKVDNAARKWASLGRRNDVDRMNAFINQVTMKSLLLWKQRLLEAFGKGVITGPDVPLPFLYTTIIPGDLPNSPGWTEMSVSHEKVDWAKRSESTSWSVGAKAGWGLFSGGGGVTKSSATQTADTQVSSFSMSFELAQAVVIRPWMYPEWFLNRGWTLRSADWPYAKMPSDGQKPPDGAFIGYSTQVVFVRNVQIKSAEFVSAYKATQEEFGANASIGWGPFKLSGSYSHAESDEEFSSETDGETLKVAGMQIIGFVNHLIGKAPNPDPELKEEDFVA